MTLTNVINRDIHYSDRVPDPLHSQNKTRIVQNWLNFKMPGRDWQESNLTTEEAVSIPDNWTGAFDFKYQQLRAPLQVFAGDSTDASNTALFGARIAATPENWFNIKFLGVTASQPILYPLIHTIRWNDIYVSTDMAIRAYPHKLEKIIKLKNASHPASFRFALRLPAGFTYSIVDNCLLINNDVGEQVFRTHQAFGWDSATTSLDNPDGSNRIRVTLVQAASIVVGGKTFPTFRLIPNAIDLSSAIYPVYIDPTTQIVGTTSVEDARFGSSFDTRNYGGSTVISIQAAIRTVVRVAAAAIPAGTITAGRLLTYITTGAQRSMSAYCVADGNTWVEGTGLGGGVQNGSCCWAQRQYLVANWLGSAGCNGAADHDAAAESTNNPAVGTEWVTWTVAASKVTAWRDGTRTADGIILLIPEGTGDGAHNAPSTEDASNQPYWEVDYSAASAASKIVIFKNLLKKRIMD